MLGGEAIVDAEHGGTGGERQMTDLVLVGIERAEGPSPAMHEDDQRQNACARPIKPRPQRRFDARQRHILD